MGLEQGRFCPPGVTSGDSFVTTRAVCAAGIWVLPAAPRGVAQPQRQWQEAEPTLSPRLQSWRHLAQPAGSACIGVVCMFRVTRGDRGHASARGRAPSSFLPRVTSCLVFSCALRAPHADNSLPVLYLIKTVLRVSVFGTYLLDPPVVPLQADHSRSEAQLSLQSPLAA